MSRVENHSERLLVTGGAGFIGSNFIRYYLDTHPGAKITNLDALTYAGNKTSLTDVEQRHKGRYKFIKGNIGNQELVDQIFEEDHPSVVVNFAAESHNSRGVANPGIFVESNVVGTQRLLDVSREHDIRRFHHISTCEVYGDLALDSEDKFKEGDPYRPRTPYNSSKASADMIVRAYSETFGVPTTISICSNNYGPYQFPEKLIPNFITKGLEGEQLPLYESSKNKREWLHVIDHCRAIDLVLRSGREGETYNIGSGIEVDVESIAAIILEALNLEASRKTYVSDRPGHDRRYLLDSSKIRSELGWKPQVVFDRGIHDTIQWYKDNKGWWEPLLQKLGIDEMNWGKKGQLEVKQGIGSQTDHDVIMDLYHPQRVTS
jgi:dTDP-glucose 4,6-dehydratase